MKILVINGVNLNMLGIREPEKYGTKSYAELTKYIRTSAKALGLKYKIVQSNYEGKIAEIIQKSYGKFDGIIINAGAYTHTSIAIRDALLSVAIPFVEVHLTDVSSREIFRRHSFLSDIAEKTITGKGFEGYKEALEHFAYRN